MSCDVFLAIHLRVEIVNKEFLRWKDLPIEFNCSWCRYLPYVGVKDSKGHVFKLCVVPTTIHYIKRGHCPT